MNINEVKTAFKVADVVLNEDHPIKRIKFIFLSEIFDENGDKLNSQVLRSNAGRIYLIVVDNKVMKIGKSKCAGGIKATMSFYEGGLQGSPSIRTFGIHILLSERLESGYNAEIYMIRLEKTKMKIKGLFGEVVVKGTPDILYMEDQCKREFFNKEGEYPIWNFQANGEKWRSDIARKLNEHKKNNLSN